MLGAECIETGIAHICARGGGAVRIRMRHTIWGRSRESLPMVLKTRSCSLLTVPSKSSPREAMARDERWLEGAKAIPPALERGYVLSRLSRSREGWSFSSTLVADVDRKRFPGERKTYTTAPKRTRKKQNPRKGDLPYGGR